MRELTAEDIRAARHVVDGIEEAVARERRATREMKSALAEVARLKRALRAKDLCIEFLVENFRIPMEEHDPVEWHGGMARNVGLCPTCRVRAALAEGKPQPKEVRG